MHKPSKFSLVWRLSNTQSPKKDAISLQRQKERSHLFPWKRATYWQSSVHDPAYSSNNNSLSLIRYISIWCISGIFQLVASEFIMSICLLDKIIWFCFLFLVENFCLQEREIQFTLGQNVGSLFGYQSY